MLRWPNRKALFRPAHVADEDLLLFLDGEMKPWKAEKVRRHLQSCWTCRAQRQKIEQTISSYVQTLEAAEGKAEPPKGWREFETRLTHFDRDLLAVRGKESHVGFRLPWRMPVLGLAIFGCLAAVGWFALPRKSEVGEKGSGRIPAAPKSGTPEKAEQSAAPNEILPGPIATPRMLQPSREEVLAKAIEIEYALHRVRACLGGEMRVVMERNGLRITGEPGSPERERELRTVLAAVSMPAWVTRESGRPGRTPAGRQAVADEVHVAESGTSMTPPAEDAVRTYLQAHPEAGSPGGGDRAVMAANYSSRALSHASAAVREAWALRRLAETYPSEGMPSQSRWLLETMLRDHLRALSADVGRAADLIAPVFGLSKTPAPQSEGAGSWQQETERLFARVEDFERRASALFGDATEPTGRAAPAADSAAALIASADQILRAVELLDHTIASAFSRAPGPVRGEGMRD
jgi:hypothetical protein